MIPDFSLHKPIYLLLNYMVAKERKALFLIQFQIKNFSARAKEGWPPKILNKGKTYLLY